MVRAEFFKRTKEMTLIKTYSGAGMLIQQEGTGALYDVAIDPDFMNRSYTETNIPIETGDEWGEPIPDPGEGWGETLPDPEEGESLEELGVPEETIEEVVEDDAEPEDPDGPVPIPEELVR